MRATGLVAAIAAITAVFACRQLVGITDNPPTDLTSTLCGLPYGTNVCASCTQANCCAESTTCAADPVCSAYESCLGPCNGDPKCRAQCTIDNPVGTASDVPALSACLATHCEGPCGLGCGAIADLFSEPDAAEACQQCLDKSACSQAEACASSVPCDAVSRGNLALSTADSAEVYGQLQCTSSAASGFAFEIGGPIYVCGGSPLTIEEDAAVSSTALAFASSCATPCATGNYWACIGQVNWPPPKAPDCTIDTQVEDYRTHAPITEATVQACSPTDTDCSQPLQQATTDAKGRASLTVQNPPDTGYHGLNGFVRVTSPTIVTVDEYWGFPLVESQFPYLGISTFNPAELQEIWSDLGVTPDPARGTLIVLAYDCRLISSPGLQITLDPADMLTQGFSTTGVATTTTDQTGIIFFSNVLAGPIQLTATPMAVGKTSSQVTVHVVPGIVTLVLVWPTPKNP
jgi:hypothetical protein